MSLENYPNFLLNFSECEMKDEEKHFYRFKSFQLNVEERQLLHHNTTVPLTPKAFDVLAVLVERSGHLVEKNDLLKEVWADSFVEEANVTRIIHTLRKVLGEDENGNKFIETVAKKGYRFVAEVSEVREPSTQKSENANQEFSTTAVDFPETIAEENSEAVLQFSPPVKNETKTPLVSKPKRRVRLVLFSVGFLSTVFLLFLLSFNFKSDSAVNPGKVKSIAVLPVNPVSAANRDEFYEIGIVDSLITRLGAMKGFVVRPLGATRKYSDINQDPIAAGKELKADYVLASNYQIVDGKIRITAQLFNVSSGKIEETYKSEKDAGNIFTLQDQIAGEVGKLLQTRFATASLNAPAAKRGTTNEEAYRLYLQGKYLTTRRKAEDHKRAIEYFEQAIRLDPNYASAYARMAHAYFWSGKGESEVASRAEKAKEIVNKALELDNNLAEAYVSRADLELVYEWNFPAVERDLLRAIELEPNNDTAHWLYALLLSYRGRFDEALGEIETAQAIDPSALMYMRDRGRILYYARRYDEAIAELKRLVDLDENLGSGWLRTVYAAKGDEARTYEIFIKNQKRSNPDRVEIYQKAYEDGGWTGVKRKLLEFFKLDEQKPGNEYYVTAMLCTNLGEKDQAFEYLNKAFEKREWRMIMLKVDPILDALRDDPRFDELVRRVGLK